MIVQIISREPKVDQVELPRVVVAYDHIFQLDVTVLKAHEVKLFQPFDLPKVELVGHTFNRGLIQGN